MRFWSIILRESRVSLADDVASETLPALAFVRRSLVKVIETALALSIMPSDTAGSVEASLLAGLEADVALELVESAVSALVGCSCAEAYCDLEVGSWCARDLDVASGGATSETSAAFHVFAEPLVAIVSIACVEEPSNAMFSCITSCSASTSVPDVRHVFEILGSLPAIFSHACAFLHSVALTFLSGVGVCYGVAEEVPHSLALVWSNILSIVSALTIASEVEGNAIGSLLAAVPTRLEGRDSAIDSVSEGVFGHASSVVGLSDAVASTFHGECFRCMGWSCCLWCGFGVVLDHYVALESSHALACVASRVLVIHTALAYATIMEGNASWACGAYCAAPSVVCSSSNEFV